MSETMKAGRELDARVAEKIFGCKVKWPPSIHEPGISQAEYERRRGAQQEPECGCAPMNPAHESLDDYRSATPPFSSDIGAAWQIVEKLNPVAQGIFTLQAMGEKVGWYTAGWGDFAPYEGFDYTIEADAPTAPHAISLAALRAVGGAQ